ncbi:NAD(P)H-binding protein [Deinococcus pimensis]|uniref:NAD(P)H-binding protein n=1 Tax=Deinococcus pimensis TaxID=309888 RepID=UPI0004895F6C|nr:NAD(P)H-binding protein [Deinococcus pimensis]
MKNADFRQPRLSVRARTLGPVLVVGATGAIGSEVVRALLERGADVRVFVRSPAKVAALPARVERVVGSLEDEAAVARAVRGARAAFYVSPHDAQDERLSETFVGACEREGVRLVFAGVHADGRTRAARALSRALYALLMPHYRGKFRLAERVRTCRADPVVLIPGNYYQNDDLCREQLLSGTYPLPLRGITRVDTRDVGDAAARALLDFSVPSGAYALTGPEALSGEQSAANWAAALGREVRHAPDIHVTDALLDAAYGGRKALDFQKSYRLLGRYAAKVTPRELRQTEFLLEREPRTHAQYARDTVAAWRREEREPVAL